MDLEFMGIGWRKKMRFINRECCLSIPKELIIGNFLKKGDSFEYHLVKFNGKMGLLVVLERE